MVRRPAGARRVAPQVSMEALLASRPVVGVSDELRALAAKRLARPDQRGLEAEPGRAWVPLFLEDEDDAVRELIVVLRRLQGRPVVDLYRRAFQLGLKEREAPEIAAMLDAIEDGIDLVRTRAARAAAEARTAQLEDRWRAEAMADELAPAPW